MYNSQETAGRIKLRAKICGTTMKSMLSNLELGINIVSQLAKGQEMSYLNLAKIADYLNCSVDYLLGRTDNPEVAHSQQYHNTTKGGAILEIKIKRGQILKDLRKNYTKQKLNQADVANIIGVSVQAYQKYEYGTAEPTFDTINKLADFYGVTTDYLLGRQEATDSKNPLDEFAQREHLKILEKLFMQKYLELTSEQRDKVLDFWREIVADEASAAARKRM